MAVTISFAHNDGSPQRVGRDKVARGRITPTGTYATGGFAVSASDFGLATLKSLSVGSAWNGTELMVTGWDSANGKIKLGWSGGAISSELDEITDTDTVTGFVMDVVAVGS